jgi:HEAT repeat protein
MSAMEIAKVAGVLAKRVVFQATGLPAAGRALVRALGSEHEDVRTVAGMSLVQAGRRSEPLLEEAARRREHLPLVLTILGDLGDPAAEPLLEGFASDPEPEVAKAARDALRTLHAASKPTAPRV